MLKTGSILKRTHEDAIMEETEEEQHSKRKLSPSGFVETGMPELDLLHDGPAEVFQAQVGLEVDVKSLFSLLPDPTRADAAKWSSGLLRVQAKIDAVKPPSKPVVFCAICDRSWSMSADNRYPDLKVVVETAAKVLDGNTHLFSVVRFDGTAQVIYGPAEIPSDAQLVDILEKLKPCGGTNISEALKVFQEEVSAPMLAAGHSVMAVLMTDGEDHTLAKAVERMMKDGSPCAAAAKLGKVSGETIHYLAVAPEADMHLFASLAELSSSTCNRVLGENTPEVVGSIIALSSEQLNESVFATVEVTPISQEPSTTVTLIDKRKINISVRGDGAVHPTDISLKFPTMKEEEKGLSVRVKLEVYAFGNTDNMEPFLTVDKCFTVMRATSGEEFEGAMKLPSVECILQEARRIKGNVDTLVAEDLRRLNIDDALVNVNQGIADINEFAALIPVNDADAAALLAIVVELGAQATDLQASKVERTRINDIRDRAYSDAMTDRNSMSVGGRNESQSQTVMRQLSRSVSARIVSQEVRSVSNVSGFGDLRMDSAAPDEENSQADSPPANGRFLLRFGRS